MLHKKNFKPIIIFLFSIFSILFLSKRSITYADVACDPYDCVGTNAYLYVDDCEPTGSIGNCSNVGVVPSQAYSCPVGGPAGSCVGNTPGIENCGGNVFNELIYTNCTCSDPTGSDAICFSAGSPGGACGGDYGGTCQCDQIWDPNGCSCPAGSCPERDGTRGCCLIETSPTPTPPTWCGDGLCPDGGEDTCANCEADCGVCVPPPSGPYCGDGICNNGENVCTCPADGCSTGGPCGPSCEITLSPSSVDMNITDAPFTITANVSNVVNGTYNNTEFSLEPGSTVASLSPVFDNTEPYQSTITPATEGSTIITATGYVDGVPACSDTANLTINPAPGVGDEAPDCSDFLVNPTPVSVGDTVTFTVKITDTGFNILPNGSFETGDTSGWFASGDVGEWWALDNLSFPAPGLEGRYYARAARLDDGTPPLDPYIASSWINTGSNLTGKSFSLKFKGLNSSNPSAPEPQTISLIGIQRLPYFLTDWSGTDKWMADVNFTNAEWTDFQENFSAFTDPGNGTTTTSLRAVLRTPSNDWPVFYDAVKLYETNTAGVNPATVTFYYKDDSTDPCGLDWTLIGTGTYIGNDTYRATLDTTAMPTGGYYIVVNSEDINGNLATGNPGGSCGTPFVARPNCNAALTVDLCAPSCGGGPCGDSGVEPNQVTNVQINGVVSGNVNLSSSPSMNITWDDPGVSDPGSTIDYYDIYIWNKSQGASVPATCTFLNQCARYQTFGKIESYTAAASSTHDSDIYVAVRAVNNTCSPATNNWSSVSSFDLVSNIEGGFFNDPSATTDAFNNCSGSTASPIDLSGYPGSDVAGDKGGFDGSPTTLYSITTPYAPDITWDQWAQSMTLSIDNSGDPSNSLSCACPSGPDPFTCIHTDTPSPSKSGTDFFLSSIDLSNGPWWQVSGGNIYGTNSLTSMVPQNCFDAGDPFICKPDLVTQNLDSDPDSAGIPMSGSIIDANGFYSERGANDPRANLTSHNNIVREDYAYLSREVNLGAADTISGTITSLPSGATPDADNTEIYYSNGDLTVDFTSTETVSAGTKIIIFVNGNLTFDSDPDTNMINVEQTGFISFISSGNITFGANIGNSSELDSSTNIEGVFVADGTINIDGYSDAPLNDDTTKDNKFVGEGTFVGWSGFNLNRDYENTTNPLDKALNNLNPIEVFNFRPDFNANIPDVLKRPSLVWQEVN